MNEDVSMSISCKTLTKPNTLKFEPKTPKSSQKEETTEISVKESIDNLTSEDIRTLENEFIEHGIDTSSSDEIVEVDVAKERNPSKCKIKISLDTIAREALAEEKIKRQLNEKSMNKSYKLRFKERIDPSKNKKAEVELETEIKKESFDKMEVLGQFNLGFIIAKHESDLFIVDQHATDERYNFEDLQKSLKIDTQKMIIPEKLELTAIQEDTIIENLPIFEMNGFRFDINKNAEATKRISLTSRPYSKNWEFGREDIEEMIFILQDAPMTAFVRPSRIRSMLASRACRKSIMIGDPLTKKQMAKLLKHMGEIDHPWNCPHGRPTIRFLQNLDFISDKK